jgi:hypothetical protein
MKIKKLSVLILTVIMTFGFTATAFADPNASWNAGKGTATIDGQKDDAYAGAQEMKMEAVSDGSADGSAASAWAIYDAEAIYFFVQVSDSELDDANANVYEKDSVEFRFENKSVLMQAYAVDESFDGTVASEVKVLKTDVGYNVEFKVPYATSEGGKVLFTLQINCASGGKRNCTLHTNADLMDAWKNDAVFETLVFSADAAAPADAPKTGVASLGLYFGISAIASAVGAKALKKREK